MGQFSNQGERSFQYYLLKNYTNVGTNFQKNCSKTVGGVCKQISSILYTYGHTDGWTHKQTS